MKINEVPQDSKYLEQGKISDLTYAVDEGGHYRSMQSSGWKPKNDALGMAWELAYARAEEARRQVLAGYLSPIAFYMELNVMDLKILADYVGLSRWRVRRHLLMKNFKKLKPALLEKYAGALNLTTEELTDIARVEATSPEHES
jgi:hypothetical protein